MPIQQCVTHGWETHGKFTTMAPKFTTMGPKFTTMAAGSDPCGRAPGSVPQPFGRDRRPLGECAQFLERNCRVDLAVGRERAEPAVSAGDDALPPDRGSEPLH